MCSASSIAVVRRIPLMRERGGGYIFNILFARGTKRTRR